MPKWIHDRAEHLLASNPSMEKGTAFAIATQQSHAKGKSPKGFGTKAGRTEAKKKYDAPKKNYEGKANPGGLSSSKMAEAFFSECCDVLKVAQDGGVTGAQLTGAGLGALAMGGAALLGRRRLGASPVKQLASAVRPAANTIGSTKTIAAPLAAVGKKTPSLTIMENQQVSDLMSRLTPAEHAALEGSSLVRKGASKSNAAQLALLSKGPKESLTDFLSRAASVKAAAEKVVGGKGDGKTDADFDEEQVAMGHKVEMEHTGDPAIAAEITRDHLTEFPDYYTRLKRMENAAKQEEDTEVKAAAAFLAKTAKDSAVTAEERKAIQNYIANRPKGEPDKKFHTFVEGLGVDPDKAEPIAYDMACKEACSFLEELLEITKSAFLAGSSNLADNIAKPKIRATNAAAPTEKLRVKQANFPTGPSPFKLPNDPAKQLAKAQKVGTPDDPVGPKFKPLNMLKTPGMTDGTSSSTSTSSSMKVAFAGTGFGPTGGVFRPRYASLVQPIGAPALGAFDPQLKEAGERESLKEDSEGFAKYKKALMSKKAGVPATPAGRLASARNEGAPKQSAPPGPSIAEVSKPVGFGKPLPGAQKNRI